jgi:UDP-2-acetamido-3-amino-2,3-dideoxy-glucuronate N-acetyltransferase
MLSEKIKYRLLQLQNTYLDRRPDDVLKLRIWLDQFEHATKFEERQSTGSAIEEFLKKMAEAEERDALIFQVIPEWISCLQTWTQSDFFSHPTAIIDENAVIGEQTKIWHFSHIMSDSEIGNACNLGQNVVIAPNVKLGNRVKVQNNVSLYTGVECGDDVFIGPSAVFTNVLNPRSSIIRKSEFRETIIGKGASIGANATIVCGHKIGDYAFIAAGAVVTSEVPDYALMGGVPARQMGWMDSEGNRLLPDKNGNAVSQSGIRYQLSGDTMSRI